MTQHGHLAQTEIDKAYAAYASQEAGGADRIIIVLDQLPERIAAAIRNSNGGNGRWHRVKRHGPPAAVGGGVIGTLIGVIQALV